MMTALSQAYWQPHNRAVARRIQNMGWRTDGGLWLLVRGGGLYLSKGTGVSEFCFLEASCVPGIYQASFRSVDILFALFSPL